MKLEKSRCLLSMVVVPIIFVLAGCANQETAMVGDAKVASSVTQIKDVPEKQQSKNESKGAPETGKSTPAVSVAAEAPVKQEQASVKDSTVQLRKALEQIYFDFDSSVLSDAARKKLAENADYLKKNGNAELLIEGNCDERGSDQYNIALGEKRAKAAMKYLVTMGIPESRLSVISYGKEKPADQGHDEKAWALNRRDEFKLTSK